MFDLTIYLTMKFTYKLYTIRDGNDRVFFRAKYQWGPFWTWIRSHNRWSALSFIVEWNDRDLAIEGITRHADLRRADIEDEVRFLRSNKITVEVIEKVEV